MFEALWDAYHARRAAAATPPSDNRCIVCANPTDIHGYRPTWLEAKLARRVRHQRFRLRELERFNSWQREAAVWSRSRWMDKACALQREINALKARIAELEAAK